MINIISYNCSGIISNHLVLKDLLINNDIIFLVEHWLSKEDSHILVNLCGDNHHVLFESDYSRSDHIKGRPFGGRCWIVRKNIIINEWLQLSKSITKLTFQENDNLISIYGIWLQFDNNKSESYINFKQDLSILEMEDKLCSIKNIKGLYIGDFNSDLFRNKRYDKYFSQFLRNNNFVLCSSKFGLHSESNPNRYTYFKGGYKATLDHAFCRYEILNWIKCFKIVRNPNDLSDHLPICVIIDVDPGKNSEPISPEPVNKRFHKFNWSDESFKQRYKVIITKLLIENNAFERIKNLNDIVAIDNLKKFLCKTMLKAARLSENNKVSRFKFKNNLNNLPYESNIYSQKKKQLFKLRRLYKVNSNLFSVKSQISEIRKYMRSMQSLAMKYIRNRNVCNVNYLFRFKRSSFWKHIVRIRSINNKSLSVSSTKINDFVCYYQELFTNNEVNDLILHKDINDIVNETFFHNEFKVFDDVVSFDDVIEVIDSLSKNKATGCDNICAEMLQNADSKILITCITSLFNAIFSNGIIPSDLNVALITPIPKKSGTISKPDECRPISVSSVFANIFETIILKKTDIKSGISKNQFGYRIGTSCKHAYFVLNETIQYYNVNKSTVFLSSLDASKAFDRLWRNGLFYKLLDKIPIVYWRGLFAYYKQSKAIINFNGEKSESFDISEGVKQGGILSPYLFNFYINDLIEECIELEIGCFIGRYNVSVLAYCDDIVLLTSSEKQMQKLLDTCNTYGKKWKIKFNSKKSISLRLNHHQDLCKLKPKFFLDGKILEVASNLIYLGLPVGDRKFIQEFWNNKFAKTEKALYSLNGIGCHPNGLSPIVLAKIYKIYCQPIFMYGLENVNISPKQLKELDKRQSILFKKIIGISKFARTTPLFEALGIDSVSKLYYKFKILFFYQIRNVLITKNIFSFLSNVYSTEFSYINNVKTVITEIYQPNDNADWFNVSIMKKDFILLINNYFFKDAYFANKIYNLFTMADQDNNNKEFYLNIIKNLLVIKF
jgi:hypothetical protein